MNDPIPTTERLAKALEEAGAPADMIANARKGYYDDYKSELALPCIQLVADLQALGLDDLRRRAMDGEFDGTPEESAAWFAEEGKNFLPPALWKEFGYQPDQHQRSKPEGFGKRSDRL